MKDDIDFTRLSQKDLAAAFGVTGRAVRDWDECPRNEDGTYDLPACIRWRANAGSLDLNAERARLACEQANRTALDNAVKRGELLSVDSVSAAWAMLMSVLRANLLGLPSKAAPRLATLKDAITIREYLTTEIHRLMEEVSNYRPGDGSEELAGADSGGAGDFEAAAEVDGESVGRRAPKAQRGVKRSARPMDH